MGKPKKQKNTKKLPIKIIFFTVLIIALCSLFFISLFTCNYDSPQNGEGWFCSYPGFGKMNKEIIENYFEKKCLKERGTFEKGLMRPIGGYFASCTIPFSDQGDPCKSSSECKGTCEYIGEIPSFCTEVEENRYLCTEEIKGLCSDVQKHEYEYHIRVEDGTLRRYEFQIID